MIRNVTDWLLQLEFDWISPLYFENFLIPTLFYSNKTDIPLNFELETLDWFTLIWYNNQ